MDYTTETLNFHLQINREFNRTIFDQMEMESNFILSCLESMSVVVLEETNDQDRKQGIFSRIISFIRTLLTRFTEKAKSLIKGSQSWMKENFPKLEKINYSSLEIQMVPFWNSSINEMESTAKRISTKITSIIRGNNAERYKDIENVKNELFKEYLDEEGNLAGGFKNFYRVGQARGPIKPVTLKGNDLKNKVLREFRSYCETYNSKIVPSIRKISEQTNRELEQIEATLSRRRATTENYCLIEDAPYNKTEIAYCENFVLLEADQSSNNQNDKVSPTKVEVKDYGSKESLKNQDTLNKMSSDELAFAKNVAQVSQISISAYMTVAEERFNAYINAIKQILKARKGDLKEVKNNNQ